MPYCNWDVLAEAAASLSGAVVVVAAESESPVATEFAG